MKIIRYDRGGEYYGRYDETEQHLGPFAKILQKRDICVQYTMSDTSQQNDLSERHNRTLMDVIRSMLINLTLPVDVCIENCYVFVG